MLSVVLAETDDLTARLSPDYFRRLATEMEMEGVDDIPVVDPFYSQRRGALAKASFKYMEEQVRVLTILAAKLLKGTTAHLTLSEIKNSPKTLAIESLDVPEKKGKCYYAFTRGGKRRKKMSIPSTGGDE